MAAVEGVDAGPAAPPAPAVAVAAPAPPTTAAPPAPEAGAIPAVPPPPPPGERVWAVAVGINDYPGTRSDLVAADNDAIVLQEALLRAGVPGDHVRLVLDGEATVRGVLDAVDWLVTHAGPDDTVVFLYAGHVRDFGQGTEAIITAERGYIADWYLADRLAPLAARDGWFVIAGCYGGGFDELLAPGRVLTAAAAPGQLAFEDDGFGMSYLGEYLLRRGLANGEAGLPTVQADVAWAMARLEEDFPQYQLWNVDQSSGTISLDGVDRDGRRTGDPATGEPPPPPPVDAPPCRIRILCGG
jgi:hypothetical protein